LQGRTIMPFVRRVHEVVSEMIFCDPYPCSSKSAVVSARSQGLTTLFLALPSFLSRINRNPAVTENDEYWHLHVDREQYGCFAMTALVYLNSNEPDDSLAVARSLDAFDGGTFEFGGEVPATIVPRKGRLSIFSSGWENPHWVSPVRSGTRYALTAAFTCDNVSGIPLNGDLLRRVKQLIK